MFFGAYNAKYKIFFTKFMKRDDFRKFNERLNLRDRYGNVRTGMTSQYYIEVIDFQ